MKYLNNLFTEAARCISMQYSEKTVQELQHWIEDEVGTSPFIALVNTEESRGSQKSLVEYTFSFVSAVSLEYDPTEQEKLDAERLADKKAKDFVYILEEAPRIRVTAWDMNKTFRDQSFLGIGKGFTVSITALNETDYCDVNLPNFDELKTC